MPTEKGFDPSAIVDGVRKLYAAMGHFDASLAQALAVDLSALRAIDAMRVGPVSPKMLSRALGLNSASITALLDRLEKAGRISRTPSKTDRRSWDIDLTESARVEARQGNMALGGAIEAAFREMGAPQVQIVLTALEDLTQAFGSASGSVAEMPRGQ